MIVHFKAYSEPRRCLLRATFVEYTSLCAISYNQSSVLLLCGFYGYLAWAAFRSSASDISVKHLELHLRALNKLSYSKHNRWWLLPNRLGLRLPGLWVNIFQHRKTTRKTTSHSIHLIQLRTFESGDSLGILAASAAYIQTRRARQFQVCRSAGDSFHPPSAQNHLNMSQSATSLPCTHSHGINAIMSAKK